MDSGGCVHRPVGSSPGFRLAETVPAPVCAFDWVCAVVRVGNDGLVFSALRFPGTLGNPKEATGNGRAVDKVICESLPQDIHERDFLSREARFLHPRAEKEVPT